MANGIACVIYHPFSHHKGVWVLWVVWVVAVAVAVGVGGGVWG